MEKLIISVNYWLYWQGSIITLISKQDTLREKVSALWWLCSLVLPAPPTPALTLYVIYVNALEWEGLATRDEYQALPFERLGPGPEEVSVSLITRTSCIIFILFLCYIQLLLAVLHPFSIFPAGLSSQTRVLLRTTPIKMEWKFLFTPSYAHQSLKLSFIIYCFSSTFFNFIYFFVFSSNFFSY